MTTATITIALATWQVSTIKKKKKKAEEGREEKDSKINWSTTYH